MIELRGHTRPVVALAYAPDGRTLVSASQNGDVRLWDVAAGRQSHVLHANWERAYSIAFAPDGREFAIGFGGTRGVVERQVFPPSSEREMWAANSRATRALAYSVDGRTLVTAGNDLPVKRWRLDPLYVLSTPEPSFRATVSPVDALAVSPGGELLVTLTSKPATLRLYNFTSRRLQKSYQFSVTWGYTVAFAPDGTVVACGLDGHIALWSVAPKKKAPFRWQAHAGSVLGVAYLPDGSGLLTCGADGLVKSWDLAGNLRRSYDWRVGELYSLAVAPDGLTAAVGGAEVIALWDLE